MAQVNKRFTDEQIKELLRTYVDKWRAALGLVGIGWYIGICVFTGVFGGFWFHRRFNASPFFIIAGLILGIAVAAYGVYRMVLPVVKNKFNDKGRK